MGETVDLDLSWIFANLLRLAIAFILAFPVGWERATSARSLGMRTFPIVSVASCGYMLIATSLIGTNAEVQARVIQGLLGGIGFIGGGAILKEGGNVRGLATAASIWNTGAIGASVAFQREEIAIVLSIINFALLRLLTPLAERHSTTDEEETG